MLHKHNNIRRYTMRATVNVVYGIGNAVSVNLESLEGAEDTVKFDATYEGTVIFTGFLEHPVTVGDVINNSNVKATLGHDNVTIRSLGISVSPKTLLASGTTTLVLEDVQSTKN